MPKEHTRPAPCSSGDHATTDARERLRDAAATIAGFYGQAPARPLSALAHLIVAPHWARPGVRRWQGGELIAWLGGPEIGGGRRSVGRCRLLLRADVGLAVASL